MEIKTLLENLKKPVSYKWKIQSTPKENKNKPWEWKKGNCVAYIDARDCMDTLDLYCEEGWQNEFYEVKGKVFCKVGIKINWEWFYRSDSWALEENDNVEYETTSKGETSDAFKRACVQWWIWRFLYEKDIIWISNEEYQANKFKINEFCQSREKKPPAYTTPKTTETPTGKKEVRYFSVKDLERCILEDNAFSKEAIKQWAEDDGLTIWKPLQDVIIHYLKNGEIIAPVFTK